MSKVLIVAVASLFCWSIGSAQTQPIRKSGEPLQPAALSSQDSPKPAYFSGRIKGEWKEKPNINVYFREKQDLIMAEPRLGGLTLVIKPDKRGFFSFSLPPLHHLGKMDLRIEGTTDHINRDLVIEGGDRIHVTITKKNGGIVATYSGKGSAKYECRKNIEFEHERFQDDRTNIADTPGYKFDLDHVDEILKPYKSGKAAMLRALDRHKRQINPVVYQILQADIIGRVESLWDLILRNLYKRAADKESAASLYKQYKPKEPADLFPDAVLALSPQYVDFYLMFKAQTELLIASRGQGYSFKQMCDKLKGEFRGYLRDRLLMLWLVTPIYRTAELTEGKGELAQCTRDALELTQTPVFEELIRAAATRGRGVDAYDFSFPESTGRMISLRDLRGKVVFMDTWYTGCSACVLWAKKFKEEIYPEFKDNPQFVVVSISYDKERNAWLESVKSGKYTDENYINLHTPGIEFFENPMTKHYAAQGAPFMLLIDKNGKIISEISFGVKSQELIVMIKEALGQE